MDDNTSEREEARQFLVAKTFFGSLPNEVVSVMMKYGHIRDYDKGAPMFERGDPGDSMFVVLSGVVKISNITVDAREVVLNFLRPGNIIGEIAVLDGGQRTATASVLEPTKVFQLFRRDLTPILSRHCEALLAIVAVLCDRLRATSSIIEDSLGDMRGRCAAGLLRLAGQHGKRTVRGVEIDLPIGQRDLGNYLGLSRENTSRQITALVSEGIVAYIGGVLIIRNEERLQALSNAD